MSVLSFSRSWFVLRMGWRGVVSGMWYFVGSAQVSCVSFLRDWSVFVIYSKSKYRSPVIHCMILYLHGFRVLFAEIRLLWVDSSVAHLCESDV